MEIIYQSLSITLRKLFLNQQNSLKSIYIVLHSQNLMPESNKKGSTCTVCFLFIMALLAFSTAVTVTVLLYVWGYMGFMGISSLSITNCTYPYHTLKYSDLDIQNKTIFCGSATASLLGLIVFLISLNLIIKNCSKDQERINEISKCNKISLNLLISLMILGSAIQVGRYLSYILEATNCTVITDSTQILVLLVLGGSTLVCEIIAFMITICCFQIENENEQKYKWINTKLTEPNEIQHRRTQNKPYFTQKKLEYYPNRREPQDTKEYIFDSPSKKPLERIQQRNAVYVNKTYNSNPNDPQMRFVPRKRQQNPVFNLHPRLANDGVDQILNAKYDPPNSNINYQEDDERYLREARRNYMNQKNNRTPILRAEQPAYERYDGTVERRRYRNKDQTRPPKWNRRNREDEDLYDDRNRSPNQYFRDAQPPRRRIESPIRMRDRQQTGYLGDRNY